MVHKKIMKWKEIVFIDQQGFIESYYSMAATDALSMFPLHWMDSFLLRILFFLIF